MPPRETTLASGFQLGRLLRARAAEPEKCAGTTFGGVSPLDSDTPREQTMSGAIRTVAELDEALSRPTEGALAALRATAGDIIVLGAGGKIGPTLVRMLRRGCDALGDSTRRLYAVVRQATPAASEAFRQARSEMIQCDLLDRSAIQRLPDAANVIYLVGQKFGTCQSPERTWIVNTLVPALVAERFSGARIVALSTGCVYPLLSLSGAGASEDHPLGPPGEYANSCVGRERVFEYYSRRHGTPVVLVRLCYAIDLRYGVLVDLAERILQGRPVDRGMGATHLIWQGDANARIIQSLTRAASPPVAVNVTGLERLSIAALATRLAKLLHRRVDFVGQESPTAWIWDARRSYEWFGPPTVSIEDMLQHTADWLLQGGATLNRPTHFEVRDGQF